MPDKGRLLTIVRSKTDQHVQGQQGAVWVNQIDPGFCPAVALDTWLGFRRAAPGLDWTASPGARAVRLRSAPSQDRPGHRPATIR